MKYFKKVSLIFYIVIMLYSFAKAEDIKFKVEISGSIVNNQSLVLSDFLSILDSSSGHNDKVILHGSISRAAVLQVRLSNYNYVLIFIDSDSISIHMDRNPKNFYDYIIKNSTNTAKQFLNFCSEFNPVARTMSGVFNGNCAIDSTCSILSSIVVSNLKKSNSPSLNTIILNAAAAVQGQNILKEYYSILKEKYQNTADFINDYPYNSSQIREFFNPQILFIDSSFVFRKVDSSIINCFNSSSEYILIDFWATWCKPCLESIPELKEINTVYKNVHVISAALLSTKKNVMQIMKEKKINWDVAIMFSDSEQASTVKMFNINFYPTYFLCDRQGKILIKRTGSGGLYEIRKYLDNLKLNP